MAVGVRTQDLRKVYNSAPPLGAAGGFIARAEARGGKQPKTQIPALGRLSLEVLPGEIFCLLGPNGAGKSTTVGVLTTRVSDLGSSMDRRPRCVEGAGPGQALDWSCAATSEPGFFSHRPRDPGFSRRLFRDRFQAQKRARRRLAGKI